MISEIIVWNTRVHSLKWFFHVSLKKKNHTFSLVTNLRPWAEAAYLLVEAFPSYILVSWPYAKFHQLEVWNLALEAKSWLCRSDNWTDLWNLVFLSVSATRTCLLVALRAQATTRNHHDGGCCWTADRQARCSRGEQGSNLWCILLSKEAYGLNGLFGEILKA